MDNKPKKIIDVEGLEVRFRNADNRKKTTSIIRDVSFSVNKGEIVGFIGESGSGKSVTAKSLFGMNLNSITTAKKFNVSDISMMKKDFKIEKAKFKKIKDEYCAQKSELKSTINEAKKEIISDFKEAEKDLKLKIESNPDEEESFKLKLSELLIDYKKSIADIKEKYNDEHSIISVKYDEQKVILRNITLTEKIKTYIPCKKNNHDNVTKSNKGWRTIRGKHVAYIPQNPMTSLNPTMKINKQLFEVMDVNGTYDFDKEEREEYVAEMLEEFGITDASNRMNSYPHEFSGGMKQRVVIAMAILAKPDLIIADEPTTALDPTIQASVLKLFGDIVKKYNVGVIFVSHDISVISTLCDYVNVFYAGRIIERASKLDLFTNPKHPYTWALLSSMPELSDGNELYTLDGSPPNFAQLPAGDAFSPRNKYAMEIDFREEAPLFKVNEDQNHYAATWLLHPSAPKVTPPAQVKIVASQIRKDARKYGTK